MADVVDPLSLLEDAEIRSFVTAKLATSRVPEPVLQKVAAKLEGTVDPVKRRARLERFVRALAVFVNRLEADALTLLHGESTVRELVAAVFGADPRWTLCAERPRRARILILGETGVGKELAGLAIADALATYSGVPGSVRTVHLTAGGRELTSDLLFGHVKGAYTGAASVRKGAVDAVKDGGCLILDEIAETGADIQVKLLRLLDQGQYQVEGSDKIEEAYFHVVALSNRSEDELAAGHVLRRDLYYRLAAPPIVLQPLRLALAHMEREAGVGRRRRLFEKIADQVLARDSRADSDLLEPSRELDWRNQHMEQLALIMAEEMQGYEWPGNYRECANLFRRLMAVGTARARDECRRWRKRSLPAKPTSEMQLPADVKSHVKAFTRRYVEAAAAQSSSVEEVARQLQVTRQTASRWLREFKLPLRSRKTVP